MQITEPTVPKKRPPSQTQGSTLPQSFIGKAWTQFETVQWTHDFDKWWEDYGRKYKEHECKGGTPAEIVEQNSRVSQMWQLLLVVWIESRVAYLKSIEGGTVRFS